MSMDELTIVALLPMKANSVRVKNKNFRRFAGKPLFRHILDTLLAVPAISRVVINTDAEDVIRTNGLPDDTRVHLKQRPAALCGDEVSMNKILQNDLSDFEADLYVMTHNTNPLLSAATIDKALATFLPAWRAGEADSLFTVNKIQTRFYDTDARPVNHDPDNLIPTQDLPPLFEENSNLYFFSRDSFKETGARIGKAPMMYETPALESIDIDTVAEWDMAEAVAIHCFGKESPDA